MNLLEDLLRKFPRFMILSKVSIHFIKLIVLCSMLYSDVGLGYSFIAVFDVIQP